MDFDLTDDQRAGVHGLAHQLGRRRARALCALLFVAGAVLLVALIAALWTAPAAP